MTSEDFQQLKAEFLEVPVWIKDRAFTLQQAREMMQLRRSAFPATKPVAEYKTVRVASGIFGEYSYPIESVHAIYSDQGRNPGQFVEVGYVAKSRAGLSGRRVEWVVKNKTGQLWPSYGKTLRDAVAGARRDSYL